jgi:hypothetical protein
MIPFYSDPLTPHVGCIQMIVTVATVIENVCISRCWKSELVAYGIHKQPSLRITHLRPLKPVYCRCGGIPSITRLQWVSSNCWLHRMPLCRDWQKVRGVSQDICNNNNLKNPPTSTSWQHNLQSSLRRHIHLKLITGFEWLSQSLD